jgi:hypothetical protein
MERGGLCAGGFPVRFAVPFPEFLNVSCSSLFKKILPQSRFSYANDRSCFHLKYDAPVNSGELNIRYPHRPPSRG